MEGMSDRAVPGPPQGRSDEEYCGRGVGEKRQPLAAAPSIWGRSACEDQSAERGTRALDGEAECDVPAEGVSDDPDGERAGFRRSRCRGTSP